MASQDNPKFVFGRVRCPKCGIINYATSRIIGKMVTCPGCGARLRVRKSHFEPALSDPAQALAARLVDAMAYLLSDETRAKAFWLMLPAIEAALTEQARTQKREARRTLARDSMN